MKERAKVFLSYKSHDRKWVGALRDLLVGCGLSVFWDQDLDKNENWRGKLDREATQASHLLVIATPASVVSREVRHEVELFASKAAWENVLIAVRATAPLGGAWRLRQLTRLTDPKSYANELPALVETVGGPSARHRLPPRIENPHWHTPRRLPEPLRERVLNLLEAVGDRSWRELAFEVDLEKSWDEPFVGSREKANAVLVLFTGDREPIEAAIDLIDVLAKDLVNRDDRLRSDLDAARDELSKLREQRPAEAAPLADYFDTVAREHRDVLLSRLRPDRSEDAEVVQRVLEDVFVQLDVKARASLDIPSSSELEFAESLFCRVAAWRTGDRSTPIIWAPHSSAPREGRVSSVSSSSYESADWTVITLGVASDSKPDEVPVAYDRFESSIPGPQAVPQATEPGRLLVGLAPESGVSIDDAHWEACVEAVRRRWPDARVATLITHDHLALDTLLALDPASNPGLPGRYVIRGHPGSGKTTLLRRIAERLAAAHGRRGIPVYVSLPRLAGKRRSLDDFVARDYQGRCGVEELHRALVGSGAGLVLLFDGFDEVVGEDARAWVVELLKDLRDRLPEGRVVVATRRIGYHSFDPQGFSEVDLLGLDPPRQGRLLRNWFASGPRRHEAERLRDEAIAHLDANQRVFAELREVPLYLTFMAMLFEDGEHPAANRYELYRQILTHLLDGRHRKPPLPMQPPDGSREALRALARYITDPGDRRVDWSGETAEVTRGALVAELLRRHAQGELADVGVQWRSEEGPDFDRFLGTLAERTGILEGGDSGGATWDFWHKSFREALVAEDLERQVGRPGGRDVVLRIARGIRGQEARWAEAVALFVGRTDDPDTWLRELQAQNPELALRALASVDGVEQDTLLEILDFDRTDVDERCRSYGTLVDKLGGDVVATASLIGQLAARTDSTQDLWFLDRQLDELERIEPGACAETSAARKRLFEHHAFGDPPDPESLEVPGHPGHG